MSKEPSSQIPLNPDITEVIIDALRQEYEPLSSGDTRKKLDDIEFKTTTDLMEEIQGFGTTDVDTVTRAMIRAGFTIRTIDGHPYWLLKKRIF